MGNVAISNIKYLSVVDKYSRHCIDNLWLLQGKDDSTNSNWYIHRRSPISKQKGEKFQMASGIVKYTPQKLVV